MVLHAPRVSFVPLAWSLLAAGCGDAGGGDTSTSSAGATTSSDDGKGTTGSSEGGEPTTGDTGGTGGTGDTTSGPPPPGIACGESFQHEGRQGCHTTVEGIDVKFFPPPEGEAVERLAVFFHGDGAADYLENWGFPPDILAWTEARHTMVVGVLSPASYEDNTIAFGAAQPEHADAVATTLEAFIAAYEPVYADATLYWGISGGSWHFSSSFIPHVAHRVPGVFVANCGGSGLSFGWAWDPGKDTVMRDKIPIYFNYGSKDFLAPNIADSIVEYEDLGFTVDSLVHDGAGHCMHPISGPTIDFWSRHVP